MDIDRNPMAFDPSNYGPVLKARLAKRAERLAKRGSKWLPVRMRNYVNRDTGETATGYGRYTRRYGARRSYGRRRKYGRRVRGRGGYWDDAFSKIGGFFGGYRPGSEEAGKTLGDGVWNAGTKFAGRMLGLGAYTPALGNGVQDQDVPTISNPGGSDGPVVIRHKEYIGDVTSASSSAFQMLFNLAINPGNAVTFPWLSQIAASFTQYRFAGLIFHYKSVSGSLSTTQALGEIIMACNYNTADVAFTNKQQMLNEIFSISKVPALDAECPIECDPAQTSQRGLLYINSGSVPAGQDPRFYNLGNFFTACQGVPSGTSAALGELWVTYQIELYKPQLQNGQSIFSSHFSSSSYTSAAPLLGAVAVSDSIGTTVSGNQINLPLNGSAAGYYICNITWNAGSAVAITMPTLSFNGGISNIAYYNGFGSTATSNSASTAQCSIAFVIKFSGNAGNVVLGSSATLPTSSGHVDLTISPLFSNL